MAATIGGYVDHGQIAAEVDRVRPLLGPDVVRMKHTVGFDSGDDPAIYFRIVITDLASREEVLGLVTGRIEQTLWNELQPYERWGLFPHFSFRSESEQAKMSDSAWS